MFEMELTKGLVPSVAVLGPQRVLSVINASMENSRVIA